MRYICSSLFPCFERIRKSKQFNSSYPAYAMYPNLTYPILTAIFHFSVNVGILEKRDKFRQFIQQVEYILICQIQSAPQFSIFSTNLPVDNINFPYDDSFHEWLISWLAMSNLYPDFLLVQRILEKRDKIWQFITQVEYNLGFHVKSLPRFSFVLMN